MTRLYLITHTNEDDEIVDSVVPEWMLPEIEDIHDISLAGCLISGYKIVVDEDPDDGEKEPIPIGL